MRIHGRLITNLLIVTILGTTTGLFISLPISPTHDVTLVESIFGRSENHQVKKEK